MARARLTRSAIVEAAFEQLAEGGLSSITARALAARLGVQAGALYHHLADMSALADEMATAIMRELATGPAPTGEWRTTLTATAHRMREVLLSYRDGARLFAGTHLTDDTTLTAMEPSLRALTEVGFPLADAVRAQQTLLSFVVGHVIEEQHRFPDPDRSDERYTVAARQARIDPGAAPLTHAASTTLLADPAETFAWGVDVIVRGLSARRGT